MIDLQPFGPRTNERFRYDMMDETSLSIVLRIVEADLSVTILKVVS
jgi:hypothetical protein